MELAAVAPSPTVGVAAHLGERRKPSRRAILVVAAVLVLAVLYTAYLRLSSTVPVNSDDSNTLLMAWDMLHGNLLLHGWYTSDVSVLTTELPQYALLEAVFGLRPETAHIAAAMTYTLALLCAVALGSAGASGRARLVRALVVGGIMVAPQLGAGAFALVLAVAHIGTAVPLLLIFLLVDRAGPRWYVPVLTAVGLTWVCVADKLVLLVAVVPLVLVCTVRLLRRLCERRLCERRLGERRLWGLVRDGWFELSLVLAAIAATGLSLVANRVIGALGGYVLRPVGFGISPFSHWGPHLAGTWWDILELYGADFRGRTGLGFALALAHLAAVFLVVAALFVVTLSVVAPSVVAPSVVAPSVVARFPARGRLIDQVLAVAIVANLAAFALSTAYFQGAHEIAVVAPFGAALAARTLGRETPGRETLGRETLGRETLGRGTIGIVAGGVLLAGYLGGLAHEAARPPVPPAQTRLVSWLTAHHLRDGLGGYWEGSVVTVQTGGRVTIRPVKFTLSADLWMAKSSWYSRDAPSANFIALQWHGGLPDSARTRLLVGRYFGAPADIYTFGPYTVLVYDRDLLTEIPR
jgi:hypothetical protein